MRIKLDENMPLSLATLLRSAGHNVSTVSEGNLLWDGVQWFSCILIAGDTSGLLMIADLIRFLSSAGIC